MTISFSDLREKNILITGAAGLIGSSIVKELVELGSNIIGIDLNQAVKEINVPNNSSSHCEFLEMDMTSQDNYKKLQKIIENKFEGKIHGYVNAIQYKSSGFFKELEDYTLEEWNAILEANLNTIFLSFKYLSDYLKTGKASVVLFSSTYAIVSPNPEIYEELDFGSPAAYSASKGAVHSLAKYLSVYYSKYGIRVNTVSPHGVANNHDPKFIENFSKKSPLNRLSEVNEVTPTILLLLSEMSSYTTGSNYKIDGGWTTW